VQADLRKVSTPEAMRADQILFSESPSRFLVTVHPEQRESFESIFAGQSLSLIGEVTETPMLRISGLQGKPLVEENIDALKAAWQAPLEEM
jgi:phosphoribosylformylglycinamidine synthase